jgi:hypothetical protein
VGVRIPPSGVEVHLRSLTIRRRRESLGIPLSTNHRTRMRQIDGPYESAGSSVSTDFDRGPRRKNRASNVVIAAGGLLLRLVHQARS